MNDLVDDCGDSSQQISYLDDYSGNGDLDCDDCKYNAKCECYCCSQNSNSEGGRYFY